MTVPEFDLLGKIPGIIAARIATRLPGLRDCKGMVGRFDVDTLTRKGVAAPAVLVSCLSVAPSITFAGPHFSFTLQLAAFIVSKDAMGLNRNEAQANIAQALLTLIPNNAWGLALAMGEASRVAYQPLVSGASDKSAIALGAVTWQQDVSFSALPGDVIVPLEIYLGQSPLIGAGNEDEYDLIGGGQP